MLSALRSALAGEAAVFLEVSQDTWDFEGGQLRETVEWALEQTQIRHLMLVGHSQSGGPRSRVSLAAAESRDVTQGGYGRLVAGVQENNARHRAAQDRLAIHVRQMSDIPLVRDRYSDGELALYSLIYRAENGIFLAYDRQEDQFHPLVG
jgi:carbonic anhydrase